MNKILIMRPDNRTLDCQHCGREYFNEGDELDLKESDKCPADDCQSNERELLINALKKIRDINTADCARYVKIADDIACTALAMVEG